MLLFVPATSRTSTVVPATREMDWAAEALASSWIPQYWVESVCREAEDTESKGRLTALHFFSLLWTWFFLESEESQSIFMSLLTAIKKAFRDPAIPVKAIALAILMDLLDTLADLKTAYVPSVYTHIANGGDRPEGTCEGTGCGK